MADIKLFTKFSDPAKDFELKRFAADIKKSKTYTELEAACVHNTINRLPIFNQRQYEQFKIFDRGTVTTAMGQGFRFIDTFGLLQTLPYKVPEPGQELCLQVPGNLDDRSETIKTTVRLSCSSKEPDIMDAHDKFVDINEKVTFTQNKIGNMAESIDLNLYLMWLKLLGTDPWGKDHADRYHSYGIEAMAFAKWDDTAISKFGYNGQGDGVKRTFGYIAKHISEQIATEIEKEKTGFKNINVEKVSDWYPNNLPAIGAGEAGRYEAPTAALKKNAVNKLYQGVKTIDPTLNLCAASRCILDYVDRFINEFTALNDSKFPGNLNKDATEKYGAEEGADKAMFTPRMCSPEDLVILMNPDLYRNIKNIRGTSAYIKEGAYTKFIDELLAKKIITVPTLSYGAIKIVDQNRYNFWTLYNKALTDTLGQQMYSQQTLHRAFMIGIREFVPARYLRLCGLYMDPTTEQLLKGWAKADELPKA